MTEADPWPAYRGRCVARLVEAGFTVEPAGRRQHWIDLAVFGSPRAESYLAAGALVFQDPSEFGLERGRISKLWIARHHRPTCRELYFKESADSHTLYNFDRGLDINRLATDKAAAKMYRTLVDILN